MDVLALHDDGCLGEGWPHQLLDVDALMRAGWRPLPFRQFILKVHSRCNLACDYCYVYQSADQSWRHRPTRMAPATVVDTAERIAQHIRIHALPSVEVVLHGGEPLLVGAEYLDFLCTTLRSDMPRGVGLQLYVQTNATIIDRAMLDVLSEHDVRVGVSLDGGPMTHDARRHHSGGRGSHAAVVRALELLRSPPYRHLFAGLLCVVDLRCEPVPTYEHLLTYEPPTIDFLLPHANWSNPPLRAPAAVAPYGHWLIAAFDRWYLARERETSVRLFDEIIRGLLGRPSQVETIGLSPAQNIVVETDGAIEQIDALKSTYDGAAYTGLHVRRDPFDAALLMPPIAARQIGGRALGETCQRCDLRKVCGGGYYPHRYRRGSGFRNPSVYCDDLAALIRHVSTRVRDDLARVRVPMPG